MRSARGLPQVQVPLAVHRRSLLQVRGGIPAGRARVRAERGARHGVRRELVQWPRVVRQARPGPRRVLVLYRVGDEQDMAAPPRENHVRCPREAHVCPSPSRGFRRPSRPRGGGREGGSARKGPLPGAAAARRAHRTGGQPPTTAGAAGRRSYSSLAATAWSGGPVRPYAGLVPSRPLATIAHHVAAPAECSNGAAARRKRTRRRRRRRWWPKRAR